MNDTAISGGADTPPLRRTVPEAPVDMDLMRETAARAIAVRVARWRGDEDLQFQYSIREYTSMNRDEWAAWKRDGTLSSRLVRQWGKRLRT